MFNRPDSSAAALLSLGMPVCCTGMSSSHMILPAVAPSYPRGVRLTTNTQPALLRRQSICYEYPGMSLGEAYMHVHLPFFGKQAERQCGSLLEQGRMLHVNAYALKGSFKAL